MRTRAQFGFLASVLVIVIALPVVAYEYPLSSTSIRDAYFLGKHNDERTAVFLARYWQSLPMPKTGPHVALIGLETPFTQLVDYTRGAPNDRLPDASEKSQAKRLVFRAYVDIYLTASYWPIPQSRLPLLYQWVPDFWDDFKVRLLQDKEIPAQAVRGGPLYSYGGEGEYEAPAGVIGARIALEYDAKKIDSEPTTVEVITPDGQQVEATFDLTSLR
jgi:hypothetical protein